MIPVDHSLHQFVTNHKVGGAGVFIDEEKRSSGLHTLDHIGRLGGAAAGVFSGERNRIFSVWKIIDKQGNICVFYAAPVLCAEFYRRVIGDDIFTAVISYMVVNT